MQHSGHMGQFFQTKLIVEICSKSLVRAIGKVLGETSKLIGCSLHIQQPAAANLYRKYYTLLLDAAAFWLQPAVMHFDVFPSSSDLARTPIETHKGDEKWPLFVN